MTTYLNNKKAHFDYEVLKQFEAGLVLTGIETKSVRAGKGKLEGGHVIVRGGEAYLVGITIAPYQGANTPKRYDSERPRKLLLHKKELAEIEQETEISRLTAIPLKLYSKGRKIKLGLAIVRGKKKHDKRESLKARDSKREIERTLKNQ
jgi:SsrA-binding protein